MSEQTVFSPENQARTSHGCPACQRVFSLPANWPTISCPACHQAALGNVQDSDQAASIELIVPPGLDITRLHAQLSQFCKGVPFPHPDFTPDNLAQRLLLVYWPVWLADAHLKGEWDAVFGYDYQVKSAREQMGNAGWTSQTVVKTRVNDEPRKGFIDRHYDNVLAPAIATHANRIAQLGEYDLHAVHPWQATDTAQIAIQKGSLSTGEVEAPVKKELTRLAALDCREASDAQHTKSYTFYGEFSDMHWTHGLLPMFTTYYEDDKGFRYVVAINGLTGKVYAQRISSTKKAWILTGILLALVLLLMLVLYLSKVDGMLCVSPAIILAFIPVIRAGTWNSKEKAKPPLA